MFCMKCGKELPDGASFCPSCGQQVGVTTSTGSMKEKILGMTSKAANSAKALGSSLSEGKASDILHTAQEKVKGLGGSSGSPVDIASLGNIVFQGSANMQYQGIVGKGFGYNKGGQLFLTESALYFKAHALNIGEKEFVIPLGEIEGAGRTFQLSLGVGISPNLIQITTKKGEKYKFVVSGKDRQQWVDLITQYVSQV